MFYTPFEWHKEGPGRFLGPTQDPSSSGRMTLIKANYVAILWDLGFKNFLFERFPKLGVLVAGSHSKDLRILRSIFGSPHSGNHAVSSCPDNTRLTRALYTARMR